MGRRSRKAREAKAAAAVAAPAPAVGPLPADALPAGILAACVAAIALVVYLRTLAPTVTLIDSGELALAARDLGVPHFLITSTLIGILAQRLVRENCTHCVEEYAPTQEESAVLRIPMEKLQPYKFKRGKGCLHCRETGYTGRVGIFEVLPMTEKIRRLVTSQASSLEIFKTAREEGMRTLREAAVEKVFRGITTTTEMVRVTGK